MTSIPCEVESRVEAAPCVKCGQLVAVRDAVMHEWVTLPGDAVTSGWAHREDECLVPASQLDALRAELAGAQAQAAAAMRERDDLRRHIREQSRDEAGRISMPLSAVEKIAEARRERDAALAQLAARDAEVTGLSPLPHYTADDVKLIEATRGKSYARLAATVELVERLRAELAQVKRERNDERVRRASCCDANEQEVVKLRAELREKMMRVAQDAYSAGLSDGHPLSTAKVRDLGAIVDEELKR